ncbi:hypothetical protein EV681_3017 [Advenella incenata]|uniref:DUF3592 domain-containing protein n=1 Tax=Advenella incenata TaxID=267800 RepID=A0A4Q7VCJ2_9BURK|nr:DUF3592 domain-containing protein [Advenella incenata]RZT94596.1 hypothetical protein EV681_3017 [Advenella incenata]
MTFAIVISVLICAGIVAYIVYLFIRDHKILSQGTDVRALVEDVRYISSNDGGSITIRYRLSWTQGEVIKQVEGKETIPAFYSSKVQKGCEVNIRYLDDNHILFVFDK